LANLPGIGLAKAKAFWTRVTNPDIRAVLPKIPAYLKLTAAIVTEAGERLSPSFGEGTKLARVVPCVII
jgi:hypothetical protein